MSEPLKKMSSQRNADVNPLERAYAVLERHTRSNGAYSTPTKGQATQPRKLSRLRTTQLLLHIKGQASYSPITT